MTPALDIVVACQAWDAIGDIASLAARVVAAAAPYAPDLQAGTELSVLLCDSAAIRALNRDWRNQDRPTNVLSFAAPGAPGQRRMLGDIAIAFEQSRDEALAEGKPLADHFAHLLAHGYLHLLGFDHDTDTEAETMEDAERCILARLGMPDPYLDSMPVEVNSPS